MTGADEVRFDGRVAVVTGAGGGLGREHALLLAARGARVVVNDVGGSVDGSGHDTSPTQSVVKEIIELGGDAVGNFSSVATPEGGAEIIETAIERYGRLDVVVNNAGILRDQSFAKVDPATVKAVLSVHLNGAINVTHAAWPIFREQKYGRVINTTSPAGVFGNFGQAIYGTAKAGLVGLTKTLAVEGGKYGITANAIAPFALTRMTESIIGPLAPRVRPGLVSPLVAYLASERCCETGSVYTVGGGRVAKFFTAMTDGWTRKDDQLTPEDVRDHWMEINDTSKFTLPQGMNDDFRALKRALS
ncbi:MAG: SDR family NAD(P)-dependent oxidoreductase [Actinomycetota bacterium]|nr:SDR family NAD(P)-dependent oxidoreductase [Actinomycetota bacterium]